VQIDFSQIKLEWLINIGTYIILESHNKYKKYIFIYSEDLFLTKIKYMRKREEEGKAKFLMLPFSI